MPTRRAALSVATFVRSTKPGEEFFVAARDGIRVKSPDDAALLRFANPVPSNENVTSALLRVRAEEDWAGSRTLTAQRVESPGGYRRINFDNFPEVAEDSSPIPVGPQAGTVQWWEFDVTDDVIAGGPVLDFQITSSDATARYLRGERVRHGAPELVVQTTTATVPPQGVRPDGIVSVSHPVFEWTAPSGLVKIKGEAGTLDEDGDWATTTWTSADVLTGVPKLDTGALGYTGLADGASAAFRFYQDLGNGWSDPSDPVLVERDAHNTLTLDDPDPADPTPPLSWTFADQEAYQVEIVRNGVSVFTSEKRPGADQGWTPKIGALRPGDVVERIVRTFDSVPRVGSAHDPEYVEASVTTTYTPTDTVTPMDGLTVDQMGSTPALLAKSVRDTLPDEVLFYRDGDIGLRQESLDGLTWVDWTAAPNRDHLYAVAAVTENQVSEVVRKTTARAVVTGVWLVDTVTGLHISFAGYGLELTYGETSQVLTPQRAAKVIRRTTALRGAEIGFTGSLDPVDNQTLDEVTEALWELRRIATIRPLRLILDDLNIPGTVSGLWCGPDVELTRTDRPAKVGRFTFEQSDEYPFEQI